jgi:hypothetical protein
MGEGNSLTRSAYSLSHRMGEGLVRENGVLEEFR